MDCQTPCPSRIVSPVKSIRPSEVTTSDGIGGALLRTLIPTPSSVNAQNISRGLKSRRIPENVGRTRCPIEKTINARNPTVSAWRDAPQIPGAVTVTEAQIPSSAATTAQTYASRTNSGNLVLTPPVFD